MATIDNSPQYKELTTSNNGRNVRASLQAVSHFFLEDNIFSQTETDSFGAKSATAFATTARVTFSGTKKVYSICQGQVFIQPQTGSTDKVNVILKPYKQPINSIPIKYIIYRGLNKNDFFTSIQHEGDSRLRVAGSENTGTGFVQYIWKEFNKFYTNVPGGIPVFLEEFIGFPASENSQNLTDMLDRYFYHISQYDENTGEEIEATAYELPLIPRGIHIGDATGSIGIDIVMNNGEYYIENDPTPFRFDLSFARSAYHTLQTNIGHTDYENKLLKEIAAQFMDIASLYGMHTSGVGKLYMGEQTVPLTTKEDIYNTIAPFFTKNTVYLYIQSDRQRSYNFYGNYVLSDTNPNNLKIGASESALTETSFGTNGWPVHIIDLSSNSSQSLFIKLLAKYNSEGCFLYSRYGDVQNRLKYNFVLQREIFDENLTTDDINYTSTIELRLNTLEDSIGENISSIIHIIYLGVEVPLPYLSNESNIIKKYNKKLLFELYESPMIKSFYENHSDFKIITVNKLSMVKLKFDIDEDTPPTERIVLNKIIFDKGYKLDVDTGLTSIKDRVLYVSQVSDIDDDLYYTTLAKELTNNSEESIKMQSNYRDGNLILSYNKLDGEKNALLLNKEEDYFLNMFQLGLTFDEINQLTQILPNDAKNIRFCFDESLDTDDVDIETNVSFLKFNIGVIFENGTGILETLFPSQSIQVFGSRINFLASKSYIEYEKNSTTEINNTTQ